MDYGVLAKGGKEFLQWLCQGEDKFEDKKDHKDKGRTNEIDYSNKKI